MINANMETPIPMDEDSAISEESVTYRVGSIQMSIPLFTLHTYRLFDKLTRAIKFKMLIGEELIEASLSKLTDFKHTDAGIDAETLLRTALLSWQGQYPKTPCPPNLAALISEFSWPTDKKHADDILMDWLSEKGISKDLDNKNDFTSAIADYIEYNVPAFQVIQIIDDLDKINTSVKKKLLGEKVASPKVKHWPGLLSFTFPPRESITQST